MSPRTKVLHVVAFTLCLALARQVALGAQVPTATPTIIAQVSEKGGSDQAQVAVAGKRLFFVGYDRMNGHELWVSDGTDSGTRLVKDIFIGDDAKNIRHLTAFGDRVLFLADDGTGRFGRELWISDGTEAGTRMVADLIEGRYGFRGGYFHFAELNPDVMLFVSWHDIYRTDGTEDGTHHLARIPGSDNQAAYSALPLGDKVIFTNRYEIWVSDGTSEGTMELAAPGQIGSYLVHGDKVFVGSKELWSTDGTPEGTSVVKDIFVGPNESRPRMLRQAGDRVVFAANDGRLGHEFHVTDGTESGTMLLKDVTEGVEGSPIGVPEWQVSSQYSGPLAFFALDHGRSGRYHFELWRSDGTTGGTFSIKDDFSTARGMGRLQRVPFGLIDHEGHIFFLVSGRVTELWQTDGTVEGTQLVPISISPRPSWMASMGGHLYAVIGSALVKIL